MKVTTKILILVLSIALAIGGVMVYAKTRVEPPTAFQPINQFEKDLNHLNSDLNNAESVYEEDMIYLKSIDRISVFEKESRLTQAESDKYRDRLIDCYSNIFLKRCFLAFDKSVWKDIDHHYMLTVSKRLHSVKHSDGSKVLNKTTIDSLALVKKIIANYRQAKKISRSTTYRSVSSAQNTINQAKEFANDKYISKCKELRIALYNVRTNIEQSHYAYISAQVEKLLEYPYFSKQYYIGTLIPQVDAAVSEYCDKATALYGSIRDTDILWDRAKGYYKKASEYYSNQQSTPLLPTNNYNDY